MKLERHTAPMINVWCCGEGNRETLLTTAAERGRHLASTDLSTKSPLRDRAACTGQVRLPGKHGARRSVAARAGPYRTTLTPKLQQQKGRASSIRGTTDSEIAAWSYSRFIANRVQHPHVTQHWWQAASGRCSFKPPFQCEAKSLNLAHPSSKPATKLPCPRCPMPPDTGNFDHFRSSHSFVDKEGSNHSYGCLRQENQLND